MTIVDGNPPERIKRIVLGEDTPEEYIKHSRDFEEHMKSLIGTMTHDEWLAEYSVEAKKRGFINAGAEGKPE